MTAIAPPLQASTDLAPVVADPGTPRTSLRKITGVRKTAILLTSIGNDASASILRHLSEEEVYDVTREISRLADIDQAERNSVLEEFMVRAQNPEMLINGGLKYATSVLVAAFGPETGSRMAERLAKSIGADTVSIDSLRKADPQQLAHVVEREHPQTIALILCHLGTAHAAELLRALPAELRSDVAKRMAALDQISPEIVNRIAKLVGAKLRLLGDSSLESYRGVRAVAEVLNRIDTETSEQILGAIETDEPDLAKGIRHLMFVFDDLLNVNQDSLRAIIAQCDRKVLTLALKGTSPQLRKHFTSTMSGRAAEMLVEDMEALGPVRIRDVDDARQVIIEAARKLQAQGLVSLHSSSKEELVS